MPQNTAKACKRESGARPLDGIYYYMECGNAFACGLYPAAEFRNEAEATQAAADYEAVLHRQEYRNGAQISDDVLYRPSN